MASRGSGQYYGSHRSGFGIEDGISEVEMQIEYEGITFKAAYSAESGQEKPEKWFLPVS